MTRHLHNYRSPPRSGCPCAGTAVASRTVGLANWPPTQRAYAAADPYEITRLPPESWSGDRQRHDPAIQRKVAGLRAVLRRRRSPRGQRPRVWQDPPPRRRVVGVMRRRSCGPSRRIFAVPAAWRGTGFIRPRLPRRLLRPSRVPICNHQLPESWVHGRAPGSRPLKTNSAISPID